MKIEYIGHSGFALILEDFTIIIDFFKDEKHIIPEILNTSKCVYILCSHAHQDHYNPEIFSWSANDKKITYILSNDIKKKLKFLPNIERYNIILLKKDEDYEDENLKIRTFGSTDVGVSFLISLPELSVFHAGDLNNWSWTEESTEYEIKDAEMKYLSILQMIQNYSPSIDVVMFPVDPRMRGDYSIGARQFVHAISVEHFIPMHFWKEQQKACDFKLYRNDSYGEYHCMTSGDTLII